MNQIEVRVCTLNYDDEIRFGIFCRMPDGSRRIYDGKEKWIPFKSDDPGESPATFIVRGFDVAEILTQLAAKLEELGYRAPGAKVAENEMTRVEKHLQDSIAVRDRMLSIVESYHKATFRKVVEAGHPKVKFL